MEEGVVSAGVDTGIEPPMIGADCAGGLKLSMLDGHLKVSVQGMKRGGVLEVDEEEPELDCEAWDVIKSD